jgi:hypothetical protein
LTTRAPQEIQASKLQNLRQKAQSAAHAFNTHTDYSLGLSAAFLSKTKDSDIEDKADLFQLKAGRHHQHDGRCHIR